MGIFVLIMVLSTYTPRPLVITAEFNSFTRWEEAKRYVEALYRLEGS